MYLTWHKLNVRFRTSYDNTKLPWWGHCHYIFTYINGLTIKIRSIGNVDNDTCAYKIISV